MTVFEYAPRAGEDSGGRQVRALSYVPFRASVPVRWSDQDINGHVNNARVASLVEEARVAWRRNAIDVEGCNGLHDPIVVASLQLDYRRSIEFGLDLEIEVRVQHVGVRSYRLGYKAYQGGHLALEGSTVHVPLNSDSGQSRELRGEELAYLTGQMGVSQL